MQGAANQAVVAHEPEDSLVTAPFGRQDTPPHARSVEAQLAVRDEEHAAGPRPLASYLERAVGFDIEVEGGEASFRDQPPCHAPATLSTCSCGAGAIDVAGGADTHPAQLTTSSSNETSLATLLP